MKDMDGRVGLTCKQVYRRSDDIEEIKKLYDRSFPDNERIPFAWLLQALGDEQRMFAAYDGEELVGMYFLYLFKDLVYLSYICVREDRRSRGYGSLLLKKICFDLKGKKIVIDIEECRQEDEDYLVELRRRNFYLRNGFEPTGIFYHIYDVDYELLCFGGPVRKEEWHRLISHHWGKRADTAIYREG
ncbi:MAG: GNAT family N-acetyltransferase [Erysipelotrichaceae bacterium]|nr:GNAT family N-acetyltransferase [Erysipelotrichaceae bacterium]